MNKCFGEPVHFETKNTAGQIERNTAWEGNQDLIERAFIEIFNQGGRRPRYSEIAEKTGLSLPTIKRHMNGVRIAEATNPLKIFAPEILLNLTDQALGGSIPAIKLWLQVVCGWSPNTTEPETSRIDFRMVSVQEISENGPGQNRIKEILAGITLSD
jgi:hypothetical protein